MVRRRSFSFRLGSLKRRCDTSLKRGWTLPDVAYGPMYSMSYRNPDIQLELFMAGACKSSTCSSREEDAKCRGLLNPTAYRRLES